MSSFVLDGIFERVAF